MATSVLGFPPVAGLQQCSSPDASVEGSAGRLAPAVPRLSAGGPGRNTSSAGSPSTTPTSPLMHYRQQGQQQGSWQAPEQAAAAPAMPAVPSATLAAALGLGLPGPAHARLGATTVPPATMGGSAAAPRPGMGGDGGLGLDLPLLDDMDDLPGLDDLLLDASAGDALFADPFGGLDSPWEPALKAEPLEKSPKLQQPQAPQPPQPPRQAQRQQPLRPEPPHPQAQAAPASVRNSFATSPQARQPILLVRQQQAQEPSLLVPAHSAGNRRSHSGAAALPAAVRAPAAPPTAPAVLVGSCKRSAGAKPGSRTAASVAAPTLLAPAQQPRREQQRQAVPPVRHQPQQSKQQPQQAQKQATLPAQGAKRALPAPPAPEVFRLPGISLPLPAPEQLARAQPPAERWVLLDASCRRPVKRAALGGISPAPPPLDVAALRLSAAAPLLAAPDAPALGGQRAPTGGLQLLQHIFGGQLPARRQPRQRARASPCAKPKS